MCLVDRRVDKRDAFLVEHRVEHRVVERTRQVADRLVEGREAEHKHLPVAEVAGRDEHALAVFLKVIQRTRRVVEIVFNEIGKSFAVVFVKLAKIAEDPAEILEHSSQYRATLIDGLLGEGYLEI